MVILDITKKNGKKCTRMCEMYKLSDSGILYMSTVTNKYPHEDETIQTIIITQITNVIDVKEVKRV